MADQPDNLLKKQFWPLVALLLVGGAGSVGTFSNSAAQQERREMSEDIIRMTSKIERLSEQVTSAQIDAATCKANLAKIESSFLLHETKSARSAHGRNR